MTSDASNTDFSVADGHGYVIDRNYLAACRLNLQHYLWKDTLKFSIHPSIQLPRNSLIADVAAGTGMWLMDVARELPGAQLDGLDIDLRQAPHPKWLPTSISMKQWNIFEDVPDELIGKYDLVHVRLLVLAMGLGDAKAVIRRFLQLLKPGGYLQWDDLNTRDMCLKRVDPSVQGPALEKLREMSWSNGRHDWLLQLPEYMADEGMKGASIHLFGDDSHLVRAFNEQHLLMMDEFASGLVKVGKTEGAKVFYNIINSSYQESLHGAALCIPRMVCVGRKPLER